jgi:iron complex outermembrane receptor protein
MSQVSFAIKATLRRIPLALATTIAVAALRPASAASAGPSPSTAQAAASAPGADPEVEQPLDEIVVEAAVPGAVIGDIPPENRLNPAQIAAYGDSTINDLLNDIAQQTQSDQGRGNTAPIILVNGKRVSGVNEVGDLPTESILRVDILPEEVALRYGYGAQQKVVNIILRRRFRAKLFDLNGSESTDGGGESDMADANYSRIHDNDRVNVVARVRTQESILESDRGVSSTAGTVRDPTGSIGNDSGARTLEPATNTYSLNSVLARTLSQALQVSFNAMATYQTTRAKDGYPAATLDVPASSPYAQEDIDATVDRYLVGRHVASRCQYGYRACGHHPECGPPRHVALVVHWHL